MVLDTFYARVTQMIGDILQLESDGIRRASGVLAAQVEKGGRLFVFGTGHSHLIAEEAFGRAGGAGFVRGIFISSLMLHEGLFRSTHIERLSGIADVLFEDAGVASNDVLLVVSNSGRNAVPIEMAEAGKRAGIPVFALTSKAHSESVLSRHESGRKLMDIADVVLDNHGIPGDASVQIGESGVYAGPTSTITGSFLINALILETLEILHADGFELPVFRSANA